MDLWEPALLPDRIFLAAFASGRMPHAWILSGRRGQDMALFAERAATFLVVNGGRAFDEPPVTLAVHEHDPQVRLIAAGAHAGFQVIKRQSPKSKTDKTGTGEAVSNAELARSITIGQVRDLIAKLKTKAEAGHWRAIIIDSIDDLERSATNALLKILEEPPEQTVFLLVSYNPGRLLPTIRSRCRVLRFADSIRGLAEGQGEDDFRPAGEVDLKSLLMEIAMDGDRDGRLRVELSRKLAAQAERRSYETFLTLAGTIAADTVRATNGVPRANALAVQEDIVALARHAIGGSEDPATVTFAIASALSRLNGGAELSARQS